MDNVMSNTASSSDGLSQGVKKTIDLHGRTNGPARRSTKGQWTAEEDDMLCKAVERFKSKNWKKIAECIKDRTDVQCLHRWQKVLNPEFVKGPWTKEEDEELIQLVHKYGQKIGQILCNVYPGALVSNVVRGPAFPSKIIGIVVLEGSWTHTWRQACFHNSKAYLTNPILLHQGHNNSIVEC